MEKYIILHNASNNDIVYINPNFIESIQPNRGEIIRGNTVVTCTGDSVYFVIEEIGEVRKKVWGTT